MGGRGIVLPTSPRHHGYTHHDCDNCDDHDRHHAHHDCDNCDDHDRDHAHDDQDNDDGCGWVFYSQHHIHHALKMIVIMVMMLSMLIMMMMMVWMDGRAGDCPEHQPL